MKIDNIKYYIENNSNKKHRFNGFTDEVAESVFFDIHDDHWHYYDMGLMNRVFEEIDTIPDQERFYYPIVFVRSDMKDMVDEHLIIPTNIIESVKKGQCLILVQSVQEGWTYHTFIDHFINAIIKKYDFEDEHFVLMTGNYHEHERFKTVYHSVWEIGMPYHWNSDTPSMLDKIRPYKYICLNRRPEMHRMAITTFLSQSKQPGILTMSLTGGYGGDPWAPLEEDFSNRFPELINVYNENVKPNLPLTYDDGIDPETYNPNYDNKVEKFHQSYLHIVTETNHSHTQLFFSEKIFKPIVHWQPFVIVGNPGSLALLKEFGYKTFGDYIDESYDRDVDVESRLRKIFQAVTEFINKPAEELTRLMQEMLPIFEHNMNHLRARSETIFFDKTRSKLQEYLND